MTQGHAMQVLVRAHALTRDPQYYAAAQHALEAMFLDIADGGVRIRDPARADAWWYAEYPSPSRPRRVLNGMMFALVGIHELWVVRGDERARTALGNGLRAALQRLSDYDTGSWSRYDARGTPAGPGYHRIHVNLLWRLYVITGQQQFKQFAERWQGYAPPPRRFRWCKFDLLLAGIVFLIALALAELALLAARRVRRRLRSRR
jgi:hypothetical protein